MKVVFGYIEKYVIVLVMLRLWNAPPTMERYNLSPLNIVLSTEEAGFGVKKPNIEPKFGYLVQFQN
jgi:hypothetical protein